MNEIRGIQSQFSVAPGSGPATPSRTSPQGPKSLTVLGMMLAMSISIRVSPQCAAAPRRAGIRTSESNVAVRYRSIMIGATTRERSHAATELPGMSGSSIAISVEEC